MRLQPIVVLVYMLSAASLAWGQSLNVDIGTNTNTEPGFGPPSSAFGAAAISSGTWNNITATSAGPFSLLNTMGQGTGVTMTRTSGTGTGFSNFNPSVDGDYEKLLDDGQDISVVVGQTVTYTINNLAANTYDVYTYANRPGDVLSLTNVSVANASGPNPQIVGGTMQFNTLVQGVTHAVHRVVLTAGQTISITVSTNSGAGIINGFQIVAAQACCLGDGTCLTVPTLNCYAAGGTPQGVGSTCGGVICPTGCSFSWHPIPAGAPAASVVAETTWDPDGPGPQPALHVIGGSFTSVGGVPANRIAAWDGFSWSALGDGLGSGVNALTVYNGELIAGGFFTAAGGVSANRIARWNGTSWQPLGSGIPGTLLTSVAALAVFNGELIAGGNFSSAGGVSAPRLARWNGSAWQNVGTSPISGGTTEIRALTVFNNELIAGGQFTTIGGVAANRVARWNGIAWQPLGGGTNLPVRSLAVFNSQLIVGGEFTVAGGIAASRIARWNGTAWQTLGSGLNNNGLALVDYGGTLIVGGQFTSAGNVPLSRIAQWDGASWRPLGSGTRGDVFALSTYHDQVTAGGSFTSAGDLDTPYFARWGPTNVQLVQQPAGMNGCDGGAASFSVVATGSGLLTYQWRKGGRPLTDGDNVSGALTDTLSVTPLTFGDAGDYDVVVTSGSCSRTSDIAALAVYPNPVCTITATPGTEACLGETITLDAGAGYRDYFWSTGGTTQTIKVTASGEYSVLVTDGFGCQGACGIRVTFVSCGDTAVVTLNAPSACVNGDQLVVSVDMTAATTTIVGGQFFWAYDTNALQFVSADPGDAPFTLEIHEAIDENFGPGIGAIDYLVGIAGGDGTQADSTMARLTFNIRAEFCSPLENLATWREKGPNGAVSKLSDDEGGEVEITPVDLYAIRFDRTAPTMTACPADVVALGCNPEQPADCDDAMALAAGSDGCGPVTLQCVADEPMNAGCHWSRNFQVVAVDECGNPSEPCIVTFDWLEDFTAPTFAGEFDGFLPPIDGGNPPAGFCLANVAVPQPTASDACDPAPAVSFVSRSDGLRLNDPYSPGTTTITWQAEDACGNIATAQQDVLTSANNELVVVVEQGGGTMAAGSYGRAINFELADASGPVHLICETMTFTGGLSEPVTLLVPCQFDYTCLTAQDVLHTLRQTIDPVTVSGAQYVADFTGARALIGGNVDGDEFIDILDFAIIMNRLSQHVSPDTTCALSPYHADVNGDGVVDLEDVNFVQVNFFQENQPGCGESSSVTRAPVTSVTRAELLRRGQAELAVADVNHDGVVDRRDITTLLSGGCSVPVTRRQHAPRNSK